MNTVLQLLKGIIPILEPIGENGINELFVVIDGEIAKMSDSSDLKTLVACMSPALKQFLLIELKKLPKP